jgi:hypothetical protein
VNKATNTKKFGDGGGLNIWINYGVGPKKGTNNTYETQLVH